MTSIRQNIGLDVFALTEAGPFRDNNEDVVLARPDLGLFVVADGLGGRPLGERAAALAADGFAARCTDAPSGRALLDAFRRVNDALHAESVARGLTEPMAAVATVAWVQKGPETRRMLIGHLGDTRAHLFDAGGAGCQLTRDQGAVDADAVPESEALAAPGRNVVARALGLSPWSIAQCEGYVELREVTLEPGCTLVLVSDGITDYLDRARTAAIAAEHASSAEGLARALAKAALEAQQAAGSGDNIGIVVVRRKKEARESLGQAAIQVASWRNARILTALAAGTVIGSLTAGAIRAADYAPGKSVESSDPRLLELGACDGRARGPIVISLGAGAIITVANGALSIDADDVQIVLPEAAPDAALVRERAKRELRDQEPSEPSALDPPSGNTARDPSSRGAR